MLLAHRFLSSLRPFVIKLVSHSSIRTADVRPPRRTLSCGGSPLISSEHREPTRYPRRSRRERPEGDCLASPLKPARDTASGSSSRRRRFPPTCAPPPRAPAPRPPDYAAAGASAESTRCAAAPVAPPR